MRTAAGGKPMQHRQGGWLHVLRIDTGYQATAADLRPAKRTAPDLAPIPTPATASATPEIEPLDPDQVDLINRVVLAMCPLTPAHRAYLLDEGVNPDGCGSLKYSEASRIARQVVKEFGEATALRHPAIIRARASDGRTWLTIAGATDGILFPATSVDGRIMGIQVRRDKVKKLQAEGEEEEEKESRYRWLSHDGLGGTPLTVFRAGPGARSAHHLIITEGFKKGSAATGHWECSAMSLAGVSAYQPGELIRTIEALGISSYSLAFDQDKRTKPQVREAERRMLNLLAAMFPALSSYVAEWDGSQAKGLDDAIKAGTSISFKPYTGPERRGSERYVNDLPAEALDRHFTRPEKVYTIEEARALHRSFFDMLLRHPDGRPYSITSPTGTGKSRAGDEALAQLASSGFLQKRVLLLVQNKANLAERTQQGTDLRRAIDQGFIAVQQGRQQIDLADPQQKRSPFDCANPQAQDAGQARQITARVVCSECPFGSAANWEKAYPGQPRPFKCEQDGYIASRRASEKAQAVIATKESFLNSSDQVDDFDIIICDEALIPYLYETIKISTDRLTGWLNKMDLKEIEAPAWRSLIRVITRTFERLAEQAIDDGTSRLRPALADLEETAAHLDYDWQDLLLDCGYTRPADDGSFEFEQPYKFNAKLVLPFRAARELLAALEDRTNPARFARDGQGYMLLLHAPRSKMIRKLAGKTLVILDATIPPTLKKLFPTIEEIKCNVAQNLHVTQTLDGLYSKRDLFNPATREKVNQANTAFAARGGKHLTLGPLRFKSGAEALDTPEGGSAGHWGLDDRATNTYQGFDSLTIVGHHMRPIDYIRAEVEMFRSFLGEETPAPASAGPGEGTEDPRPQKLRLYKHALPYGRVAGRWMKYDQDQDVQAAIEHDYQAHVIQAIGRLRAALRPADAPPARVLILCNEPVGDLPIDLLTTVGEMITMPPKEQGFIHGLYMKPAKNGGMVLAYTAAVTGQNVWDEDLIQDETPESQADPPDPWDSPPPSESRQVSIN
jgi:hypothetical protein